MAALSAELETPLNVHRWRKLEGTDPAVYEALLKIQARAWPTAAAALSTLNTRARCLLIHASVYAPQRVSTPHHCAISCINIACYHKNWLVVELQPAGRQALQKRLLQKSEEVADRDLRLKEAAQTRVELEAAATRLPGPEAAQQLAVYQARFSRLSLCGCAMKIQMPEGIGFL